MANPVSNKKKIRGWKRRINKIKKLILYKSGEVISCKLDTKQIS